MSERIRRYERVGSTNDMAKELAASGAPSGTTVLAREQTAGRGRRGRVWFSPAAGNVYLSYIHRSRLPTAALAGLTLEVASVLAAELAALGLEPEVEWPNDVLLGGRKVAGVLTELVVVEPAPVVVIGLGVNVNLRAEEIPAELRERATSLLACTGREQDGDALAEAVVDGLDRALSRYEATRGPDVAAYLRYFRGGGRAVVSFPGREQRRGRIVGIADDGALRVVWDGEAVESLLRAGEIERIREEEA